MAVFEGQLQSPFIRSGSFEIDASEQFLPNARPTSPFVERMFSPDGEGHGGQEAARRLLVAELYDEEMDEALYELIGEVAATSGLVSTRSGAAAVRLQFAPLLNEVEAIVDRVGEAFASRPLSSLSASEIDEVTSRPASHHLPPAFDNFLSK